MPRPRLPISRHRHRADAGEPDRFLFVLKIVGIVVISGIAVGFILLAASGVGGGGDDAAVKDPAVPTITNAGGSDGSADDGAATPAEPLVTGTMPAPAVGRQTAVITPKAKHKPARPPVVHGVPFRPGRDVRIGRIGHPCPQDGAIAFTAKLQPLMCQDGRWDRIGPRFGG
jgi:hypothetical protein